MLFALAYTHHINRMNLFAAHQLLKEECHYITATIDTQKYIARQDDWYFLWGQRVYIVAAAAF